MHVPMAFAHETLLLTAHERGPPGGKCTLAPGLERPGVGLSDRIINGIEQVLKIFLHRLIDRLGCPKAARGICCRDASMKGAHLASQAVNVRPLELARGYQMAQ